MGGWVGKNSQVLPFIFILTAPLKHCFRTKENFILKRAKKKSESQPWRKIFHPLKILPIYIEKYNECNKILNTIYLSIWWGAEVLKMIDYFLLPVCMESHLSGFHNLLWVNLDLDGFGGFPMSSSSWTWSLKRTTSLSCSFKLVTSAVRLFIVGFDVVGPVILGFYFWK